MIEEKVKEFEAEGDMVLVPRGLLGAAMGAIKHPQHPAPNTLDLLKHYAQAPSAEV